MIGEIESVTERPPVIQTRNQPALGLFNRGHGIEQGIQVISRYDDDPVMVRQDDVTWIDRYTAAYDGDLQLTELGRGSGERCGKSTVNGKGASLDVPHVPISAVHNNAGQIAREGSACEKLTAKRDLL